MAKQTTTTTYEYDEQGRVTKQVTVTESPDPAPKQQYGTPWGPQPFYSGPRVTS